MEVQFTVIRPPRRECRIDARTGVKIHVFPSGLRTCYCGEKTVGTEPYDFGNVQFAPAAGRDIVSTMSGLIG